MPRRIEIKIELSEKEAAKVMYEMLWNEKTAIVKRAKILHYANIGTKSLTELCNLSDCKQVAVKNVLRLFENNGIEVMYDVSRGKKKSRLDDFEQEIEEYFDKNPPRSICEAIKMIKEKFGITITETPLRNWLKKSNLLTENQKVYR